MHARGSVLLAVSACFALPALLACGTRTVEDIPVASRVTIKTHDGRIIRGRLVQAKVDSVVVEDEQTRQRRALPRTEIADLTTTTFERSVQDETSSNKPQYTIVTVPTDTTVAIELDTALASESSRVEDRVRARTRADVAIDGLVAIPKGSELVGEVTRAGASNKVKGRARLAFALREVEAYGKTYTVDAAPLFFEAEGTKKADAAKIGIGAGAGAIIGAIAGGKKGAAVGSAVGAGAGTAVVLTTPGKEVELPTGFHLTIRLRKSLTVEVPTKTT